MARRGVRIIDAELHLLEPYDGWAERLPEPWRSRTRITAPPGGYLDTGHLGIDLDGRGFPVPEVGEAHGPGRLVYRQGHRRWKEAPELARLRVEATPAAWLEGMDMDGIDVALLTPTLNLKLLAIDGVAPEHAAALCRAYNDYAAEFAGHDPGRFKFWGWLPRQAPEQAAEEARRCVEELGAVGVAMTTAGVDQTVLTDDAFEPLWAEIEGLGVPLGLHLSGLCQVADDVGHRYQGHPRTEVVRMAVRLPFYSQTALAELILGGVLDAHPGLRVVLQEANVAWLPWLLWRMDEKWSTYGPDQDYELTLAPSGYFARQCFAVADADESVARLAIDHLGDDNLLWSSDFPHHDSTFPGASDTFLDLPGISAESKRKILWDNGARLFALADAPAAPADVNST
ncbi:MAG: amidohydrolase [Actinomycetota bacterium]|nr:amidohydrolase [Acidimicrobiia bacterium]MDQ3294521.1 amidohydrolase [Actinomycetota bacterium]